MKDHTIVVNGIEISWDTDRGTCEFGGLPVAMMWVNSTLAGLMSGVQRMIGTERFLLALQSEGRNSIDDDWTVISAEQDFPSGFLKIADVGQLTGGIAHDFNNILSAVLGYSNLALQRASVNNDETQEQYLKEIIKGGIRARDLVEELLLFSRGKFGHAKHVSVNDTVLETVNLLRGTLPASIEVTVELGEELPAVLIDPVQLEQMLLNLCINARDAMQEFGMLSLSTQHVELDASQTHHLSEGLPGYNGDWVEMCVSNSPDRKIVPGEYVEIRIEDSGCGIPAARLSHIFEPFFTTKEIGKGSGMGLSVVHGIMQRCGGHLIIRTAENRGCVFRLLFDSLALPCGDSINTAQASEIFRHAGNNSRILIVDDDDLVLGFMENLLTSSGFEVEKCRNGDAALRLFQTAGDSIDLVITDQTMPRLTGDRLAARLLEIRSDLPIILLSGHTTRIDQTVAERIGISAFLKKPVDSRTLLGLIDKLSPRCAETRQNRKTRSTPRPAR